MPDHSSTPDLHQIQAGILSDHHCDHAEFLFFKVTKPLSKECSSWFREEVCPDLSSEASWNLNRSGELLTAVSLSHSLSRLVAHSDQFLTDPSFIRGMDHYKVCDRLADPIPEKYWESGYLEFPNLLILLASNNQSKIQAARRRLLQQLPETGQVRYLFSETGRRLYHTFQPGKTVRVEHFGYADGISNDAAPKDLLVREGKGLYGSYLVFRKLEQDVALFRSSMRALAMKLGGTHLLPYAEAQLVGRFRDGTPLVHSDQPLGTQANDFDYQDDPEGRKCPLHAHIRKVNPRHSPPGEGGILIGRRSIPYDEVGRDEAMKDAPKRGVGLLFCCYQTSITDQFEHIQGQWASNRRFPRPGVRADRMVGQRFGRFVSSHWNRRWGNEEKIEYDLGNLVWLKGGGYFYTPSIPFVEKLAGIRS